MSNKAKTTTPKPDGKPALVPKLRFPEFRDAEGWEEQTLSFACQMQAGKFVSASEIKEQNAQGLYPCYGGNGLRGYTATFTHSGKYSLIGRQGALCGNVKIGVGQFHATEHAVVVTPKNGIKGDWLFYLLDLLNLNRFATGQAQPGLSVDVLEKLPIAIPNQEPEQQKIAECLSSVDELIAAQARKLDALKTHKKGLMQQLFPREGETQPRLRFPEFQNAGEWESTPLGQLLVGSPDYGVNAAAVPFSERLPKYLRITDISEDGTYLCDKMVSVDIEPTAGNYLDEGDIALARTGASVGKSYRYRNEDGRLVFAGFLIRIKPAKKKLVSAYLANFLTTGLYWEWVAVTSARSGQPGINSTEYSSLSIPLPPGDLAEQQRIAACLTSLDDLIAAQTQKLDALKTHKKGLMQQLFPSPAAAEA